jgi:small subunit ribosomal protein S3Ae
MAVGKNKKLGKKKKGTQKKVDPFLRKEFFKIRAPAAFKVPQVGYTVATKTTGNKTSKESLMGRVIEVALGDLQTNAADKASEEADTFRKIKLRVEEVSGSTVLTNFYGLDLTTDKLRSLVRKWFTLIEVSVDVKTADGYALRIFCIGFTQKLKNQQRKTSYAQSAQVKQIRKRMTEIITREASSVSLNELVLKFIPETIGKEIERKTHGIYPLQNVMIRKVKMLKSPKTDVQKLYEIHGGADAVAALGKAIEREDEAAAAPEAAADAQAANA